jgi:hypothetical protein
VAFPIAAKGWSGRASFLRDVGWGLAVLYHNPDRRALITRAAGAADARDAVARCRSEGLPVGTVCYLDLHDVSAAACADYWGGWIGTMLDSGTMQPGVCCAAADAALVRLVHGPMPLWVVGTTSDVDADIVEFPVRVMGEVHDGVALHVRHCAARTDDPSRPSGVLTVRELIDRCLDVFGRRWPQGIAGVEMDVTVRDGATTARLRISGPAARP